MVSKKGSNSPSIFMWTTFLIITICHILAHNLNRSELVDLALKMDNANRFNWLTQDGHWYRYFTHSFLHASFLHYFMNMFNFLIIYCAIKKGKVREHYIIFVYCTSVILGGLSHMMFNQESQLPTILIGASGGIFGLIGMLTVFYFKSHDYKTLKLTLMIDLPLNIIIPLLVPKVSWIAHLVGFIVGTVIGMIVIESSYNLQKKRFIN
jgi:membrane associated rhomboid family serine protease